MEKDLVLKLLEEGTLGLVGGKLKIPKAYSDQVYVSVFAEVGDDKVKLYQDPNCPVVFSDRLAKEILSKYPELKGRLITVSKVRSMAVGEETICLVSVGGMCIDNRGKVSCVSRDDGAPVDPNCFTFSMNRVNGPSIKSIGIQQDIVTIGMRSSGQNPRRVLFDKLDFNKYNYVTKQVELYRRLSDEAPWTLAESIRAFVLDDRPANNTIEIALVGYFEGIFEMSFDDTDLERDAHLMRLATLSRLESNKVPVLRALVMALVQQERDK